MTAWEDKQGNLYLRLFSGMQVDIPPNQTRIIQHRYSVHLSGKSAKFNTIKTTFELENGEVRTSTALTDAIKTKKGLCPIAHIRFSDLSAALYDVAPGSAGEQVTLGEFDPGINTWVMGIYVCNKRKLFPTIIDGMLCHQFTTKEFRIIILYCLTWTPSTPFGWILDHVTLRPEDAPDSTEEKLRWLSMEAIHTEYCREYFMDCYALLLRRQLEDFLPFADQVSQEKINELLAQAPKSKFLHAEYKRYNKASGS